MVTEIQSLRNEILNILQKGGVEIPEKIRSELKLAKLLSTLESWIGLSTVDDIDDENNGDMDNMEDAAPFDASFYLSLESFLISVWDPEETSRQPLFGLEQCRNESNNVESVSLYRSIISIRVTRFICYWMELNVRGAHHFEEDGNREEYERGRMLSFQLLNHSSYDIKSINTSNAVAGIQFKVFPLIRALYNHIERLPYLQSQIHLYIQFLRTENTRGNDTINHPGVGIANPQLRLAQLKRSQEVKAKLENEFESHIKDLEKIVGEFYAVGTVDIRRHCRAQLGSVWSNFEAQSSPVGGSFRGGGIQSENTTSSGIAMTLRILHRIIIGIKEHTVLCKSYHNLLFHHLIPLHRPNSMVLWRDQTSLLELYHEPLVQCIAALLKKKPEWTGKVIKGLLEEDKIWNKCAGNTPKLVLLLHEIDTYIGCLPNEVKCIQGTELGDCFPILLREVGSCMASENSRLAQRALPFIKNETFVRLIQTNLDLSLNILLPFLLQKEPSWNPTVKKMTYNVLKMLQNFDNEQFLMVGNQVLTNERQQKISILPPVKNSKTISSKKNLTRNKVKNGPSLPGNYSIKAAMGEWIPADSVKPVTSDLISDTRQNAVTMPPPLSRSHKTSGSKNPPLAVTGVAPWAMSGAQGAKMTSSRRNNPQLGLTAVAPWSTTNKHQPLYNKIKPDDDNKREKIRSSDEEIKYEYCPIVAYMKKIQPPIEKESGISFWSKDQMAESPTLLPSLKFHDLVFGHDLGEGSFGCVRYARRIDRTTTRSKWPEYAVKIISTEKIKEMGYEASVQRELAVLRILSHPCISRLISSFRFLEGVYLVLEYASGGDLHSLLRKNGSLDHDSTRFVVGEVTSALASIHEIGLGYFDLKPENVIITESGHIKLTDFGGSRPVTTTAKELINNSAKNVFRQLRDGDWKTREKKGKEFDMDDENMEDEYDIHEYDPDADLRIEGTTIYLPPEVVLGSFPSLAADSWALGCLLYQCVTGRPPICNEVDEALAKNRIVSFDVKESQSIFEEDHASNIENSARDLITLLMNRNAKERPEMNQVADHSFFKDNGVDVFSLWRQPPLKLAVGHNTPPPVDAGWARRQLSSIWAPQPQAYDVSWDSNLSSRHSSGSIIFGPILEGEEAPAFFSKTNLLPSIRPASNNVPLPPRKK